MPPGTSSPTDPALARLIEASQPRLRAFLLRLCGTDADDVLQETLAKVWRLRAGFNPDANGEAWLLQAAFRCFCDHRARRNREPGRADVGPTATPAPRSSCPAELRDEVRHRLAELAPIERSLLLGFHAEGLSLRELAERHGLALNTVKSHLHRARNRLQEHRHE